MYWLLLYIKYDICDTLDMMFPYFHEICEYRVTLGYSLVVTQDIIQGATRIAL